NLHVTERGRRLNIRNQAFVVEEPRSLGAGATPDGTEEWFELLAIPHQKLDRIDLHPGVDYTPQALEHALATDTVVAFVDGFGATKGFLAASLGERAGRHLAQAAVALDTGRRLDFARAIVEGRLRNQRSLLRKLLREIDSPPPDATHAIAEITHIIGRGDTSRIRHAPSIAATMGYEGAASAAYWKAIGRLCDPSFAFQTRARRQREHRAGIALDFLAWLLHRDARVAVTRSGLHPGIGALHTSSDNQDACVYDLMEEFRATMVEGLFVYLTNRRILRADMFVQEGDALALRQEGQHALIRAYESRMNMLTAAHDGRRRVAFRRLLVEQAFAYAKACETGVAYQPHVAKH
ncbi:partial CRISPR-associated endonuclease Cas1, partial [Myxococcaceae bacterium]